MRARLTAVLPIITGLLMAAPLAAQDATPTPIPRESGQPPTKRQPAPEAAEAKSGEPAGAKGKRTPQKAEDATKTEPPQKSKRPQSKTMAANAAAAPLATCEEARNENGLRMVIYPPSAQNVRVAIFDRGGKEIDRDLFTPAKGQTTAYARVLWGTRNTPPEKLLKGAFLISTSQKGRFFEGMLMADGGDGSFMVQRMHLGKPEDDAKLWRLRLGVEQSLLCRVDGTE